jgi:hypothetical protein
MYRTTSSGMSSAYRLKEAIPLAVHHRDDNGGVDELKSLGPADARTRGLPPAGFGPRDALEGVSRSGSAETNASESYEEEIVGNWS